MSETFVDSYDPRVWASQWARGREAAAPAPARSPFRARALSLGLATGVIALGAGAAWLSRAQMDAPRAATAARPGEGGPAELRRTLLLSGVTELQGALARLGVAPALAARVAAAATPALRPQGEIRAVLVLARNGGSPRFARLEASNGDSSGTVVRLGANGVLDTTRIAPQVSTRIMVRHGLMDGDSFYSSAVSVGIPNNLIPAFAKALAFDFDFQREVAAGDAFEAAYSQAVNASGELVGAPTLLYASLTTATKSAAVYRLVNGGNEEWFDSSGRSIVRSLMRTPVDGARVSSKFGWRIHPIEGYRKLHGGIDFAAPMGTPIYAAGNGVIEFAGPKGWNGNFVKIRHDNGWETLYLHMNRFMPGIVTGARVSQGQQIGEVGTTGHSTGPHLHYEVHINGERVDPSGVPTDSTGKTLMGTELQAFERARDQIDISRAQASGD